MVLPPIEHALLDSCVQGLQWPTLLAVIPRALSLLLPPSCWLTECGSCGILPSPRMTMQAQASHAYLPNTSLTLLLLWVLRPCSSQHKKKSSKEILERLFLPDRKESPFLATLLGMLVSGHNAWMNHEENSTTDQKENHIPVTVELWMSMGLQKFLLSK